MSLEFTESEGNYMDIVSRRLKNSRITKITAIYDYWQIGVADTGHINIYNPVKYLYDNRVCSDLSGVLAGDIVGQTITDVIFKEKDFLKLKLANKNTIHISLADCDYTSPEAIEIRLDTGEWIVE